jgi:hypothetical protein
MGVVGLLIFCVVCFWSGTSGQQQAGKLITFKTICENGIEGCTWKENCSSIILTFSDKIRIIDDETLARCVVIEVLDLGSNINSEISTNAFRDQTNLQTLFLRRNRIKFLQLGVFDPLTSLRELYLHKNSSKIRCLQEIQNWNNFTWIRIKLSLLV